MTLFSGLQKLGVGARISHRYFVSGYGRRVCGVCYNEDTPPIPIRLTISRVCMCIYVS